jgi:RND family efflux transporter MFP subunit
MRTRILAGALALVVVLSGLVLAFGRREPRLHVATSPATSGAIARQVLATGTLEPGRMVEVGAQVSGTIAELPADFNTVVKTGQIVARLDPAVYQSQLAAAQGVLAQARAEASQMQTAVDDAKRKLARAEELSAQDLITQAELDTARLTMQQIAADLRGRQAAIQSAQAGVKQAEVDLDRTVIRSPINGIVVNRNIDVGQTIAATLQSPVLFTIADLRSMHLLTEVNEGEIGGVSRGSRVSFQIESLGPRTFYGTVTDVRLQPYAEQANAVATAGTAGASGLTPASTTGTPGTPVSLGTTSSQTAANSASTGSAASGASTPTNATTNNPTATTSTTSSNVTSASGSSSSSTATPGAVTYTAVVDVPNVEGVLAPGATAIVTLGGGSRQDVVRLPNNALSFRPSPAMLERTGQADLVVRSGTSGEGASGDRNTHVSQVWRFENNKFVPLDVVTGLSDDRWTELVSGPVQAGDLLVTNAGDAGR